MPLVHPHQHEYECVAPTTVWLPEYVLHITSILWSTYMIELFQPDYKFVVLCRDHILPTLYIARGDVPGAFSTSCPRLEIVNPLASRICFCPAPRALLRRSSLVTNPAPA
jgi:hypothetical protein